MYFTVRRDACYWRGYDYTLNLSSDDRSVLITSLPEEQYALLGRILADYGSLVAQRRLLAAR